jgi:hypothetical protein
MSVVSSVLEAKKPLCRKNKFAEHYVSAMS